MPGMNVLVLVAHPDLAHSRVNRGLLQAARGVALAEPARVQVRDLYALYPDYAIDVATEREAAAAADLIVWQHPVHWYAMPALMKLWVDEVLGLGWAYGPGGDALRGKDLWLVLSTGGSEAAYTPGGYNRHFFDAFLPPYAQTAALCGLRLLPPWVQHGAHALDGAAIDALAHTYADRLSRWPDWPELEGLEDCPDCRAPAGDRPGANR